MTDKLKNIIVKIVDKKKGIKLVDLSKYLEGKATEIKGLGDVNFNTVKSAVISLFSESRIDLIEYKAPGEGEKNRIFVIPMGTDVSYTDQPDPVAPPELVTETKTILPVDMFEGFVVIGDQSSEFVTDAVEAQASYMAKAGQHETVKLYGAVPIVLTVTPLLDTSALHEPVQAVEETLSYYLQAGEGVSEGAVGSNDGAAGSSVPPAVTGVSGETTTSNTSQA